MGILHSIYLPLSLYIIGTQWFYITYVSIVIGTYIDFF